MKKIILSICLLVISILGYTQICVPGTLSKPDKGYIIPDSATNFVYGCIGQPYEQIIYIKVPKDTVYLGTTTNIDSFVIDGGIGGLPTFLSAATVPALLSSPSRLLVKGDSLACIKISGNIPGTATAGTYPLNITAKGFITILGTPIGIPLNVTYYKIVIQAPPCWPAAVNDINKIDFDLGGIIPNPANTNANLQFESKNGGFFDLHIVNNVGQSVYSKEVKASVGKNSIALDFSNLASGVYMYSLSDSKNKITKRLVISK